MFTKDELQSIEYLKINERAFGLLDKNSQEIFRKVGVENCEVLCSNTDNTEIEWKIPSPRRNFDLWRVYQINPDYQPKPEAQYRLLAVDKDNEIRTEGNEGVRIDLLICDIRFDGFYLSGIGEQSGYTLLGTCPGDVPHTIREGHRVYVKLVEPSND